MECQLGDDFIQVCNLWLFTGLYQIPSSQNTAIINEREYVNDEANTNLDVTSYFCNYNLLRELIFTEMPGCVNVHGGCSSEMR